MDHQAGCWVASLAAGLLVLAVASFSGTSLLKSWSRQWQKINRIKTLRDVNRLRTGLVTGACTEWQSGEFQSVRFPSRGRPLLGFFFTSFECQTRRKTTKTPDSSEGEYTALFKVTNQLWKSRQPQRSGDRADPAHTRVFLHFYPTLFWTVLVLTAHPLLLTVSCESC